MTIRRVRRALIPNDTALLAALFSGFVALVAATLALASGGLTEMHFVYGVMLGLGLMLWGGGLGKNEQSELGGFLFACGLLLKWGCLLVGIGLLIASSLN